MSDVIGDPRIQLHGPCGPILTLKDGFTLAGLKLAKERGKIERPLRCRMRLHSFREVATAKVDPALDPLELTLAIICALEQCSGCGEMRERLRR